MLYEIRAHWSTCTLIENKQQHLSQKISTICRIWFCFLQLWECARFVFNSQQQGIAEIVIVLLVFWFSLFCQKYWTIHNGAWSTSCLSGIPKQHFSTLDPHLDLTSEFCSSLCHHYFVKLWEWMIENLNLGCFLTEPLLKMCLKKCVAEHFFRSLGRASQSFFSFFFKKLLLTGQPQIQGRTRHRCCLNIWYVPNMLDFEVAMRAVWTVLDPTHHIHGFLFHLTHVLKPWVEWTMSRVCFSWRAARTSTSTWKGGQRRTDAVGRWCKRSWSSTPFQVVHFLDSDVCLFVILPEGWKHPPTNFFIHWYLPEGWKQKTMN